MYNILMKYKTLNNVPQLWSYYTNIDGVIFETNDTTVLNAKLLELLQINPVPVLKVVENIPFTVAVEANPIT